MVLSSTPFTTRLQPEFTSPFESTIQPEICNTGTPQTGLSGRASPAFAQGVEERGPARLQARLPRDPPGRPAGTAPKSEVPSFLLLQQLLKISEVETPSGGKCGGGKDSPKVGQRPERVSPEGLQNVRPNATMLPPRPLPSRPGRAPRARRYAAGHRRQSHSTDNTQTAPARRTPTHPTTGSAIARRLPTWSKREKPAGPRPPSSKARYLNVAVCVQAVPAPP